MQARCMKMAKEGQKLCHSLNEYLKSSTSDAGDMLSFKTIFSKKYFQFLHLNFCTKNRKQFSRMLVSSSRKKVVTIVSNVICILNNLRTAYKFAVTTQKFSQLF